MLRLVPGCVVVVWVVHGLLRLRAGVVLFAAVLNVSVVVRSRASSVHPQTAAVTVVGGVTTSSAHTERVGPAGCGAAGGLTTPCGRYLLLVGPSLLLLLLLAIAVMEVLWR